MSPLLVLHHLYAGAVQVVPGTRVGAGGPAGFPTLKTLALDSDVRMAGVEVFGQPSKKESLILLVKVRLSRRAFHRVNTTASDGKLYAAG